MLSTIPNIEIPITPNKTMAIITIVTLINWPPLSHLLAKNIATDTPCIKNNI